MTQPNRSFRSRLALLAVTVLGSGSLLGGCGLSALGDAVTKGALDAVQAASRNFFGSLFIDFNEIWQSTPNFQIPTL